MVKVQEAVDKAMEAHENKYHFQLGSPTSNPMRSKPYIVVEGDTMAMIAKDHLGQSGRLVEILALNGMENVDEMFVGQELKLPF